MTSRNRMQSPEPLHSLSDELLCRKATAGDHEAFLELFDRYWRQVFRLAYVVIRDEAEAEDLAQVLFLEVHRSMLRFDVKKGSFRTLLLRYAYTRAIDHRRRLESRRFYSNARLEALPSSSFVYDSPLTSGLSIEEGMHLIEEAMKHLDAKQRATVEAYFFRGLSLHEIAQELGDSFGNARHHLYRGLQKMRKLLVTRDRIEESGEADRSITTRLHRKVSKRVAAEVSIVRARTI
jgi:RNA polymerase sigma-70 factor, ECF subfamily